MRRLTRVSILSLAACLARRFPLPENNLVTKTKGTYSQQPSALSPKPGHAPSGILQPVAPVEFFQKGLDFRLGKSLTVDIELRQ